MEEIQAQAAEPAIDAGAAPEESASAAAPETQAPEVNMNDFMRQVAGLAPASKPDAVSAPDAGDAQDEESAPDGASKPSDQPRKGISRRDAPAEIERLRQENARLQQVLTEINPPPPDPDEAKRQAYLANESRFRSLIALVDDDPRLAETIEVNGQPVNAWNWLQEEKRRRMVAPELAQQYETALEAERARLEDDYAKRGQTFIGNLRAQVNASLDMPGIEPDERKTLETTTDWLDHVLIQRAAERRVTEARFADENARLRKENEQLKRESLSRARVPVEGGRSNNGPARPDMNEWLRQFAGITPR